MNHLREKIYTICKIIGYRVATYISSDAIVYTKDIQEGCFIALGSNNWTRMQVRLW